MAQIISASYSKNEYIAWHNENIKDDNDVDQKLCDYLNILKSTSQDKLAMLGTLLNKIVHHTQKECRIKYKHTLPNSFDILLKHSNVPPSPQQADTTFKSHDSVMEKLWRKNRSRTSGFVCLENIQNEITDLIRTSIISPTLLHSEFLAHRIKEWQTIVEPEDLAEHFSELDSISVDEECKMASGYFAYHAMAKFKDGLHIEVQIYSKLSDAWRHMSHALYEQSRISEGIKFEVGSSGARIVSLGHLLHLAECELSRLADDFKPKL